MNNIRTASRSELAKHFELSIITNLSTTDLQAACQKAVDYGLAGVFCADYEVPIVKEVLAGSDLYTGAGVAFPMGTSTIPGKVADVAELVRLGATSIDYVMNLRAIINDRYDLVKEEANAIRGATDQEIKVIVECCLLTDDRLRRACDIAAEAGIDIVKSSTGQLDGPTFEQTCIIVDQLKDTGVRTKVAGVKAPRPQNAMVYLLAGIELIGTQQAFQILDGIDLLRERGIFG